MDFSISIYLLALLAIAGLLLVIILLTKKGTSHLDVDKYRSRWLKIEQGLVRDEPSSCQLAVLNADKLLDQALRERGIEGETMGARMKNQQTVWTNANTVWSAHKLRNQIAHESDVVVSYDNARYALAGFKQALKDLGAI